MGPAADVCDTAADRRPADALPDVVLKTQHIGALRDVAYDLDADYRTWLANMCAAFEPMMPGASRMMMVDACLHGGGATMLDSGCLDAPTRAFMNAAVAVVPASQIHYVMKNAPLVGSFSEWVEPMRVPNVWSTFSLGDLRFGDFVGVRIVDGGDRLLCVTGWYPEDQQTSPALRAALTPIAAHISTMYRLRRSLGGATLLPEHGEAVFEVDGRCAGARDEATSRTARESLREHVRRVEKARTRKRTADGELWGPLVEGRWTLVDRFDTDGRRYYVAIENAPSAVGVQALSTRERQVSRMAAQGLANKEIAYALGLSGSSVATYLRRSLEKLRLRERSELPLIWENTARAIPIADQAVMASSQTLRAPSSLTPAEQQVVELAARGQDDRTIARGRSSSARTVANLLRSAYKKLGVANRTELVRALLGRQ